LSQSLAVKSRSDSADLQTLDVLFAVCVHVLIVAAVLIMSLWHKPVEFHPQSVQVNLVSAKQLEKLQRATLPPKPKAKPKQKPKLEPSPPPKLKAKAPQAKPEPVSKPKPAKDFDPFKPLESTTDTTATAPHVNPDAAEIFAGQLSEQEINRYIAMMQDAVQRHWKVPNIGRDVQDPLVEMVLNPGGTVKSVKILESSGNDAFDASLIRAIEAAAPFQLPAREFEMFRSNKIRFRPLR